MIFFISRILKSGKNRFGRHSRHGLILAIACLSVCAALAGASILPSEPENAVPEVAKKPDYSGFNSLEFFRGICATSGIPYANDNSYRLADGNDAHLTIDT